MTVIDRALTAPRIAVIGAGLGGIATAVKLKRAGLDNFTVFERSAGPGGVWWDNSYPGAEVDTPSCSYSYSFKRFNWSRSHARRDELLHYIDDTIDEYGLRPHLQFSTTVTSVVWDEERRSYGIRTNRGSEDFEFVITAVGHLNVPQYPSWPGLDSFTGPAFHTSRWEHGHDLRGKRVAVVGTGSTAAQVVPALAGQVGHLYVIQRDPHWVEPKPVHEYTHQERSARTKPFRYRRERLRGYWTAARSRHGRDIHIAGSHANNKATQRCRNYIASALADRPDLEKLLTPDYPYFGKRPVKDSNFYEALKRPNVELIGHAVSSVTESGLTDASGTEHPVDCIVIATGFQASRYLAGIEVRGREGRELHEVWGNEPHAFAGSTVPGFPNFFMVYGPNTDNPLVLFALERQAEIAVRSIRRLLRRGAASIEVRQVCHDLYDRWLQRQLRGSVWASVNNYYKSSTGRVVTEFPKGPTTFWIITRLIAPFSCKLSY